VLGRPTPRQRLNSWLAVGAGLWTAVTLKLNLFQHPRLTRTVYRVPGKRWAGLDLWEGLRRRASVPDLSIQVEVQPAQQQVWLRLEGRLSRAEAEGLGQRIRDSLAKTTSRVVLDLKELQWDTVEDLRPLRERLSAYRSRIRLILPKLARAHPEAILLAGMFQHYRRLSSHPSLEPLHPQLSPREVPPGGAVVSDGSAGDNARQPQVAHLSALG
jgi:hypothetical protein